MKAATLLQKVGRYGTVGLVAAAAHAGILLLIHWI
jgi:putative flippase GtrA